MKYVGKAVKGNENDRRSVHRKKYPTLEFRIQRWVPHTEDWQAEEQKDIAKYKPVFNQTLGGEGMLGRRVSEETRKKIGENNKKYYEKNPKARKEASEAMKRYRKENPDKNPMKDPEVAKRNGEAKSRYFKKHPEKHPMKNAEVAKKAGEGVKKYLKENPDKHPSKNPEAKKKMSERMKRYWKENPDKHHMHERTGEKNHNAKAVLCTAPDGTEHKYGAVLEAARELKKKYKIEFNNSAISAVARGRRVRR